MARSWLKRGLAALVLAAFPTVGSAGCDFKTGDYIAELGVLDSVRSIEIDVLEYRKWVKNGLAILTSRDLGIKASRKRKFPAIVILNFDFGRCAYRADVRQNGDFKDHITLVGGRLVQSLNVRMREGNIAGNVRFKLLLPATRNSDNEIFLTQLLRRLGFLAPRTASITVRQNERQIEMLFQESQSKEFLEAQSRREGPMFEGDERLYMDIRGYDRGTLEHLIQARMINQRWAEKGPTSLLIALRAYARLQREYVAYANRFHADGAARTQLVLSGGAGADQQSFSEYLALVLAMNAEHSLRSHNRKFYWNAFLGTFEPIYYDGNPVIAPARDIPHLFGSEDSTFIAARLDQATLERVGLRVRKALDDAFVADFARATKLPLGRAQAFVTRALHAIERNLEELPRILAEQAEAAAFQAANRDNAAERTAFIRRHHGLFPDTIFLDTTSIDPVDGTASVVCLEPPECGIATRSLAEMANLLERRATKDGRFLALLPLDRSVELSEASQTTVLAPGFRVTHASGAMVNYDPARRVIELVQHRADDWFLLLDQDLGGLTIEMSGREPPAEGTGAAQRFNEFGLTGCVNIVNSRLEDLSVSVSHGACEDSLNIVASTGRVEAIAIRDAFSDAVDLDFSTLAIGRVDVSGAGNDCFDVSAGTYEAEEARFSGCGDKGLSVGERSVVRVGSIRVERSPVGVASKDSSRVTLGSASMTGVPSCLEAYRKKQEFDGALLVAPRLSCPDGATAADAESTIRLDGA